MVEKAPDGLPIYELGDPDAAFGLTVLGGGYVVVRPPCAHPSVFSEDCHPPILTCTECGADVSPQDPGVG